MSRNPIPVCLALGVLAVPASAEAPRVAVDIAPVHSLVARVMDGVATPALIVPPGAGPHAYSLRPSEAGALQGADIVVRTSAALTPWMDNAVATLADGASAVELIEVEGTQVLPTRENALFEAHAHGSGRDDHAGHDHAGHDHGDHGHDDHGHDDHAHGDYDHDDDDHGHDDHDTASAEAPGHAGHAHGAHDPHAWLSPDNAAVWLNAIAAELSAADPDNAGAYFANAAAARADVAALRSEIADLLDPVRGRDFVVFHDAYQYFESAFDMPAAGAIAVSDATPPSPARIAQIQDRIAAQGITCVLSEPQFDPGIVAAVMEGSPANTAVLDPLGSDLEPGPALYDRMLRNMAAALADCL